VFKQRWYVLAASEYPDGRLLIYSLDRFIEMVRTEEKYDIPEDFDVEEYFRSSYGVSSLGREAELVRLRVDAWQANYFRSLPLHHSQQEVEQSDEYSIFEYFLAPTHEFIREILSNGPAVEVLHPQSLRDEIMDKVEKMRERYK
jgi:predicted DNA-binding transcriptional regulator YafY